MGRGVPIGMRNTIVGTKMPLGMTLAYRRPIDEHVFVATAKAEPSNTGGATILHADLDSFYASVEQRDAPELRGRPVLVGGGVVLAASYEAKARGVRTPMNGNQAMRLCPDAIMVPPRMEAYSTASKAVFAIFDETTPNVEGLSIDEAFLEVAGLRRIAGPPVDIAQRLRARVRDEVGLNITVGIARTKFLAKVASGVAKPDGLLLVQPDGELDFLRPLPVERLWGVGPVTATKLHDVGLRTVAEVADLEEDILVGLVGKAAGHKLFALAHNRDPRIVTARKRRRSIGSQQALGRRRKKPGEIDGVLASIVDRVTHRMREGDRVGRTVILRFRFDDFTRATRSRTLSAATADTKPILAACRELLAGMEATIATDGITLLGLSVTNLEDADAVQLSLPFDDTSSLDGALDNVRRKFGQSSVGRATNIGTAEGFRVPLLPD